MNRIARTFQKLGREEGKALVPFVTAGDPSAAATQKIVLALARGGADIVELGVPFSDPMADGPVIQKASERALEKGMNLPGVLKIVRSLRRDTQVPILLMGYYNPILAYGLEKFARDAAKAGVDAALVVDLPPEESGDLDRELKKHGLDLIYLLTPTSDEERIRIVARRARGFIYFVSMTGITGSRLRSESEIRRKISEIRGHTALPIAVGFGISDPEQAKKISRSADGVVVGSALVDLIQKSAASKSLPSRVERFARSIKSAIS